MNRIVMLILMVGVASLVNYMLQRQKASRTPGRTPAAASPPHAHRPWAPFADDSQRFHCDGRKYCSQMTSRAEAVYFIRHCPDTRMDGDHDGIPCENDSRF